MNKIREILSRILAAVLNTVEEVSAFAFVILGAAFVLVGVYSLASPVLTALLAVPLVVGPAVLIAAILVLNGARLFWNAIETDNADKLVEVMKVHLTGVFALLYRIMQWLFRKGDVN
jgi:uncharacterized membrane protein HdeD (DUF308 family)